ncbi:MAG: 30S ribosomal protein S12 methylthiotransferase RimO [Abditibacteriota bacterium]|nr:30S ribosomal protein S12 methylthiotransferase RimO [Abditibacteriota bacterium]
MAKIGFISLGCEKNTYDTECSVAALVSKGHVMTPDPREADCIIINTCGFIAAAREEAEEQIAEMLALKKERPGLKVIVAGCYVQKYHRELAARFPEADAFAGIEPQRGIDRLVTRVLEGSRISRVKAPSVRWQEPEYGRFMLTPPWTGNLKITEGCRNRCSYCAIPSIRGTLRSRPTEAALREAEIMAENGVRELVIIGQDTTAYGRDQEAPERLITLLKALNGIPGLEWIRLMYAYPDEIGEELAETMASLPKVVHYLDMPLQHADGEILRNMNRRGTAEEYLKLIEMLRRYMPDIALRTTFIAGFPGETEAAFQRLLDFADAARFDRVGFFAYSPEPGTPASLLPGRVSEETVSQRLGILAERLEQISLEKNTALIGSTLWALTERRDEEHCAGRTYRDAPEVDGEIIIKGKRPGPGEMVRVKVTGAIGAIDLQGTVINKGTE